MSFVIVPKETGVDWATVWIATDAVDPPRDCSLVHPGGRTAIEPAHWTAWHQPGETRRLHHQLLEISNLPPRTDGGLALEVQGEVVARGRLTTLPRELPRLSERPLTFLLGSCFCAANDPTGRLERAYRRLPASHRPDFKILCGDQVYLDSPWTHFLLQLRPRSEAAMRATFLDRYWSTWSGTTLPGLRTLLADGANFLSADDHEFWNNAPNWAAYVRDTWRETGRARWWRTARSLYEAFQTPRSWTQLDITPLSFFIADTRLNRDAEENRFMSDEDLRRLVEWIRALQSPGILVLGQLAFAKRHGFISGHLADWGLADYKQYPELARALQTADHSILVLTGDVHYRRVAWTRPTPQHEVYEVISSPLSLVDRKAGGTWERAPDRFPAHDIPGLSRTRVTTNQAVQGFADHFLILQCHAVDSSVRVSIFDFNLDSTEGAPGAARPVARLRLH